MVTTTDSAFVQSASRELRSGVWASAQHRAAASRSAESPSRSSTALPALILVQRCIDRGFELREQLEHFRIGERDELREDDARHAFARIDPEIGIAQPRPGETPRSAAAGHAFGADHESKAPFLDHAGKEF